MRGRAFVVLSFKIFVCFLHVDLACKVLIIGIYKKQKMKLKIVAHATNLIYTIHIIVAHATNEVYIVTTNSLGRWVSLLYRYGQIYVTKQLAPYNIGKGQFLFLLALYHKDDLPQEELAQYLDIDKGTTARAIEKLEQAGYIIRKTSENDRRLNQVFLTQKAIEFQPKLYSILHDWTDVLCEGFSEEEVEKTFTLLKRMADNASNYVKDERKKH